MRVPPTVFADPGSLGRALAAEIAEGIELTAREGHPYVLGCPGGRSPLSTYAALADEVTARSADLGHVVIVMMDDYVVQAGRRGPALQLPAVRQGRDRRSAQLRGADDITGYPGKVPLISVGFGEAATAVNNAAIALDPAADLFPGHSTDEPASMMRRSATPATPRSPAHGGGSDRATIRS